MLYFEYEVVYYMKSNGRAPVIEYIDARSTEEQSKIIAGINFLRKNEGVLPAPHAKYVCRKIWELRIQCNSNQHRIFYSLVPKRKIILLSAFHKKTQKTPRKEIEKATTYLTHYLSNLQ